MSVKDAIVYAVDRLGGLHPANIELVHRTIISHTVCLQRLLNIEAATARGDVRQLSFAASYPSPPPPAELPVGVSLSITADVNEILSQRAQNFEKLTPAARVLRAKQCLSNICKETSIACIELNATYKLMTSSPGTPETRKSAPESAHGLAGPPLSGIHASQSPPHTAHWQASADAGPSTRLWGGRGADTATRLQPTSRLNFLPLHVLTLVLEHLDSFDDMIPLCTMLPEADIAMHRVRSLSLAGPDEIGPPPASLTGLRELRLATPLRASFPVLPLDSVTLDQRAPSWTHDNSMHAISTLGLAAVHRVRLEHANPSVLIIFTDLSRPATHLSVEFDGFLTDVLLATASRLVRSFTRVEQIVLPYILQTARMDNLAHLTISNWLPCSWVGTLFADTPASLVSLEITLGNKPAFNLDHGELLSMLHYRSGRWAWCKDLRTLTLSSPPTLLVDERDVQAFVASALGRVVEVELRGVRFLA